MGREIESLQSIGWYIFIEKISFGFALRHGLVVSPASEETRAMGREIE
jgi:hypothetical protein